MDMLMKKEPDTRQVRRVGSSLTFRGYACVWDRETVRLARGAHGKRVSKDRRGDQ